METTHNINNAFGPGTANEHTVQWWFKVCKEDESLGSEERNGHHWKLTMTNWEQSSKLTLLTQEVGEELNINHFMVIQDLKQIGKVNKLDKWVPHELTANQKSSFWSVLFYVTQQSFSRLDCDVWWKWILYDNWQQPVQWLNQKKLQSTSHRQTCMKKRSWSLFDGLLLIWSTTAFWIPAKPLHLRSMLSKLKICTENRNACNQHWPTERAQISRTMPNHMLHNQDFKSWTNWATKFCLSTMFTWPLKVQLLLFQATQHLFARKTLLQSAGGRKCFPRVCQIPKHGFLCYRNKQTFFIGKNVLIVMVPILINEAVFKPSYNDLKFMVQNRN